MLRLSTLSQSPKEAVVAVYGRIAGPDIALLEREVEVWLERTEPLVLDLEGVRFIDEAGAGKLRRWIDQGMTLHDGSPFLRAQLQEYDLG